MDSPRPKIAETIIHETVRQREAHIGRRCEILSHTRIEYASLGDYSYLGENCDVADAVIGKFTAIANSVRIGAPNHPMGRPSQHRFTYVPEYYEASASRDRDFFADRRGDRVIVGHDVWIGHGRSCCRASRSATARSSARARSSAVTSRPTPLSAASPRASSAGASMILSRKACAASPGGIGAMISSSRALRISVPRRSKSFAGATTRRLIRKADAAAKHKKAGHEPGPLIRS
ncbi:hypothetical protein ACVWZ4_002565 [Bradyrhizobium sp. USDA 4472]